MYGYVYVIYKFGSYLVGATIVECVMCLDSLGGIASFIHKSDV
jgi:hypothetical protein